jgi:hypothetical protein
MSLQDRLDSFHAYFRAGKALYSGPIERRVTPSLYRWHRNVQDCHLVDVSARRAGILEEIAETLACLVNNNSRFLTRQCLAVESGYTVQWCVVRSIALTAL